MGAPKEIIDLVERFEKFNQSYTSQSYNETQLREEFVNPLFEALGWDVRNTSGRAEAYKDVIHEDAIKIGKTTKAPDYSFRIGGTRKFFLETKKPAVNIKDNPDAAYQIRRYSWSAKLPLAVLTNFDAFAVYDCRQKPKPTDKADVGRILYIIRQDYAAKWDELAGIFSKNSIETGLFDQYAESVKGKKGTSEVDDEFLKEIEGWRDMLARNIAIRNPNLSLREMNFAVQTTIDRIVFLRICEDRGIEPYGQLQSLQDKENIYKALKKIYEAADEKYNSGLFHFNEEKGRKSHPDGLSMSLDIDDKTLKDIIKRLYYPECPYVFSVLSVDILGNVYEQFLGKVIRLTESHHAKVEEKPEVKKAGGVFYTPKYIVDYIVENTVGKLVKDKTPKEIAEVKILDPACGSGSFLIGAYTYLLRYHRDWYFEHKPEKHQDEIYQGKGGQWHLTTQEKKRILLNNIYGVDIDGQAVEVTKLNLMLKVLENESQDTLQAQKKLFRERALPDLDNNIKCGNSLIGPDFYKNPQTTLAQEEQYGINVFDWQKEFPFKFDAVIGNPPYVRQEMLGDFKEYFQRTYSTYQGAADLYVYFIEKGVSLLNTEGIFGIIVANKWMKAKYGQPLRKWMKERKIEEIIDFGDLRVFEKATTYPCILSISAGKPKKQFKVVKVENLDFTDLQKYLRGRRYEVNQNNLNDDGWTLGDLDLENLLEKLKKNSITLKEYVQGEIYRGVLSGLDEAFVIDSSTYSKLISGDSKSKELIRPYLMGRDIKRYSPPEISRYLLFTKRGTNINEYPAIKNYLLQFRDRLTPRPKSYSGKDWPGRKPGNYEWFEIQDTVDYYPELEKPKIIYLKFQVKPAFTFDETGAFGNSATWFIPKDDKYLLGILNSKLGWLMISNTCTQIQNGYQLIFQYLGKIPIHIISSNNVSEKALHSTVVSLVSQILELNKRLTLIKTPDEKNMVQRQIDAADSEVNNIVYQLYGLSEEEIKIVEGVHG
ncbi:MAG: N-6 DNA methylase [Candidatus Altiarchaeota archaeon]